VKPMLPAPMMAIFNLLMSSSRQRGRFPVIRQKQCTIGARVMRRCGSSSDLPEGFALARLLLFPAIMRIMPAGPRGRLCYRG
jgi:hypothetical protein